MVFCDVLQIGNEIKARTLASSGLVFITWTDHLTGLARVL